MRIGGRKKKISDPKIKIKDMPCYFQFYDPYGQRGTGESFNIEENFENKGPGIDCDSNMETGKLICTGVHPEKTAVEILKDWYNRWSKRDEAWDYVVDSGWTIIPEDMTDEDRKKLKYED